MEGGSQAKTLGAAIEALCRNFEGQLVRLRETVTRSQAVERKIEELENREVQDQKEYDRTMDALNRAIEDQKNAARLQAEVAEQGAFQLGEQERELMTQCERIRKKVKALEEENGKRQLILEQKKSKAREEEMGIKALRERKEVLEQQMKLLLTEVDEMHELIASYQESAHSQSMQYTHDTITLKVGKEELQKRQNEARVLDSKVKRAEEGLQRDVKSLESKVSRLGTLRQVNRVLVKKMKEKEEQDARFQELTEQSMELKFLVSSLMKDLATTYHIDSAQLAGESLPFDFCKNANELLHKQVQQINQLQQTVQGRQAELARKKLGAG